MLVTGASGLIGKHVVRQLLARGDFPVVLSRRDHAAETGVEVRRGDLRASKALAEVVERCEVVIHAASELFDREQMRSTNIDGTRNLLEALSPSVEHVVVVSSIGVIGPAAKGRVTEVEQCHPITEYETTKLEAETLALEYGERTGIAVTALRPANVFGERQNSRPGDSFAALLRAIATGRFMYFGHGAIANYIYAADVADACIAAADRGTRGVIHLSDPCPLTDFVNAASSALGTAPPSKRIPKAAAYAVAAALQVASALTGRSVPLTLNRVRALTNRTIYASDRIPNEFAWQPPFGYAEGLRRSVAHYRRIGLLS